MRQSQPFVNVFLAQDTSVALAKVDRADLNGTVAASSGAVVPLADVEVVSRGTGLKRVVQTRHTGVYDISGLPIYEMNTALQRHFPVHKTLNASFRAEALNLLNPRDR